MGAHSREFNPQKAPPPELAILQRRNSRRGRNNLFPLLGERLQFHRDFRHKTVLSSRLALLEEGNNLKGSLNGPVIQRLERRRQLPDFVEHCLFISLGASAESFSVCSS